MNKFSPGQQVFFRIDNGWIFGEVVGSDDRWETVCVRAANFSGNSFCRVSNRHVVPVISEDDIDFPTALICSLVIAAVIALIILAS